MWYSIKCKGVEKSREPDVVWISRGYIDTTPRKHSILEYRPKGLNPEGFFNAYILDSIKEIYKNQELIVYYKYSHQIIKKITSQVNKNWLSRDGTL